MTFSVTGVSSSRIISISSPSTIVLQGSGLNAPNIWIQLRDASQFSLSPETPSSMTFSVVPGSQSDTKASFNVPAGAFKPTLSAYTVAWAQGPSTGAIPDSTAFLYVDPSLVDATPFTIYVFAVQGGIGNTAPAQGGTTGQVSIYNLPGPATIGHLILTPVSGSVALKPVLSTKSTTAEAIKVSGTSQSSTISRTGLLLYETPPTPFPGVYVISVTLTLTDDDGFVSESEPAVVPGAGLITYVPLLETAPDKIGSPNVGAMTMNVTFSATPPAPGSLYDQALPDTTAQNPPSWVIKRDGPPPLPGAGDDFYWDNYGRNMIVNGVPHGLIDESPALQTQLLELEGRGMLINGSPVALRVYTSKGWQCARMLTTELTYSQAGFAPTQWVVDSSSGPWPKRAEEIFGIWRVSNNPLYNVDDEDATAAARALPGIIETDTATAMNEIMLGVDKIVLVPTGFSRPVDPYFCDMGNMDGPGLAPIALQTYAVPPQSLLSGDAGYIDGIKVNTTIATVYLSAYISYKLPSPASLQAAAENVPPNPADNMACTCLGAGKVTFPANGGSPVTCVLAIASEPSVEARAPNIFASILSAGTNSKIAHTNWTPLMSTTMAHAVGNGVGHVDVQQVDPEHVLLFQRSRNGLLQVYVCSIGVDPITSQFTVELDDPSAVQQDGVLTLKFETVMQSVLDVYKDRFGIADMGDIGLLQDSWFSVLYQSNQGLTGGPGFHVFTAPFTFTSTVVHLWYPAFLDSDKKLVSPFIDEAKGTCMGIYGSVSVPSIPPATSGTSSTTSATTNTNVPTPTSPVPPRFIGGILGSRVDLVVDVPKYVGADPLYIEFKVSNPPGASAPTFSMREWSWRDPASKSANDDFGWKFGGSISQRFQVLEFPYSDTSSGLLTVQWIPTGEVAKEDASIDPKTVIDGDIWVFEILPSINTSPMTGTINAGDGKLDINDSKSHLPTLPQNSCSFNLKYIAGTATTAARLVVEGAKNTYDVKSDPIVKDQESTLDSNNQIVLSPNSANLIVTLSGTPKDGDTWEITIKNGIAEIPVSGTTNTGDWAYPIIGGNLSSANTSHGDVTCLGVGPLTNGSPKTINFVGTFDDEGGDEQFELDVVLDSTGKMTGWSTHTFKNGITFGFDNINGLPATNDHWSFDVNPAVPTLEVVGQRPVASFPNSEDFSSIWLVVPTQSAGGRLLLLDVPIVTGSTKASPTSASLLPLRTTLEPFLSLLDSDKNEPTLIFKGLINPGLTWSAGIAKEVITDSKNEITYGLLGMLREDFRLSHSGSIYQVKIPSSGLSDKNLGGITAFSTFADDDLVSEPQMDPDLFKELPPPGEGLVDVLSPDLPVYKPTAWFAIFPQYRFHIGQVHTIAMTSTTFNLTAGSLSTALKDIVVAGAGKSAFQESYFVNVLIPFTDLSVSDKFKTAVTNQMSAQSMDYWLGPLSDSKRTKDPIQADEFAYNAEFTPDTMNYDDVNKPNNLSKYILQMMYLYSLWDSTPTWDSTMNTGEGKAVPNYWKYRIGGPTAQRFMGDAMTTPCYTNKEDSVKKSLLPQYFSVNQIFVNAFGGAALSTASTLTEPRLLPSFAQLKPRARDRLINAMGQQAAVAGIPVLNAITSYFASHAMTNVITPLNANSISSTDTSQPPASSIHGNIPAWEILLSRYSSPIMTFSMIIQSLLALKELRGQGLDEIIKEIQRILSLPENRAPGNIGNRPVNKGKSAIRPVKTHEPVQSSGDPNEAGPSSRVEPRSYVQPLGENIEQERIVSTSPRYMPPEVRTRVVVFEQTLKPLGAALGGVIAFAIVAGTASSWNINADEGAIGWTKNVLNVVAGAASVGFFGVSVYSTKLRFTQLKQVMAGERDLAEQAVQLGNKLKNLERIGLGLSGVLNVAFGIINLVNGAQEVSGSGSTKLDGQLDIASGALLVVGGFVEIAGLLTTTLELSESGIGGLIAGLGMEIGIIKIWVGGRKSIGQFGESMMELFGKEGGLSERQQTINYIVRVKNLAVQAKVSERVTVSPDPNDDGAETGDFKIAPFYSVADVPPSGPVPISSD